MKQSAVLVDVHIILWIQTFRAHKYGMKYEIRRVNECTI